MLELTLSGQNCLRLCVLSLCVFTFFMLVIDNITELSNYSMLNELLYAIAVVLIIKPMKGCSIMFMKWKNSFVCSYLKQCRCLIN